MVMRPTMVLKILVILSLSAACALALYSPGGDVILLNSQNFKEQVLDSNDVWLVEFYAPWCGHCRQLAPTWMQAAAKLKGFVKVGAVDCDADKQIGGQYGIQGFPTIKLFPAQGKKNPYTGASTKQPVDYQQGRDLNSIVRWANMYIPDYVRVIDTVEKFETWEQSFSELPKVALFSSKKVATALYKSVAQEFQDRALFAMISPSLKKVAGAFDLDGAEASKAPQLFAYSKDSSEPKDQYHGAFKRDLLVQFVNKHVGSTIIPGATVAAKAGKTEAEKDAPIPKARAGKSGSGAAKPTPWIELRSNNFERMVTDSRDVWLIAVTSSDDKDPSCDGKSCAKFDEEWQSASRKISGLVKTGMIDVSKHGDVLLALPGAGDLQVPAIVRFDFGLDAKLGDVVVMPEGNLKVFSADRIESFALDGISTEHVNAVEGAQLDLIASTREEPKVLLFTKSPGKPMYRLLANEYQGRALFFEASPDDQVLVERFKITKFPQIVMLVNVPKTAEQKEDEMYAGKPAGAGEMQAVPYQGSLKHAAINQWLSQIITAIEQAGGGGTREGEATPSPRRARPTRSADEVEYKELRNQADMESVCLEGTGICVLALLDEDVEKYNTLMKEVARFYPHAPLSFGWVRIAEHLDFAMAIEPPALPTIIAINPRRKVLAHLVGQLEVESIKGWLDKLLVGKARATKMVKPLPPLEDLDKVEQPEDEGSGGDHEVIVSDVEDARDAKAKEEL